MEDIKKFSEIFEEVEDSELSEILKIIGKINTLIDKEQENFISLCYYFKQLKEHFERYDEKAKKNPELLLRNKNGRWYYEKVILQYGLTERTINKMIQVFNRFAEQKVVDAPKIRSVFLGYNKTKLFELLVLSDKQIEVAISTGRLTPDMTQKQIREYIKKIKGGEKEENKVLEETSEECEELEMAFDPRKEYKAEYYNSKSKAVLVSFCIDLQDVVQKLLRKKK